MHNQFEAEQVSKACVLCGQDSMFGKDGHNNSQSFICGACGIYRVTDEFVEDVENLSNDDKKLLYKIRSAFRILSDGARAPINVPVHLSNSIGPLLTSAVPSVQDKLTTLLIWLGKNCESPGRLADFDFTNDYTLFCGRDNEEALFLIQSLAEQQLVVLEELMSDSTRISYKLSAAGWQELSRITQSGAESSNGFIAMWFDQAREPFELAINESIRGAGYLPIRIDRVEYLNRIDDEIIARIRSARFLVADFTGQRNGVYFEAGFMLGLGRPVFWICDASDLANVHFDTRQYNTINYTSPDDLKKRLQFRIEAILGAGPHKEPYYTAK
jgi:nucleoside 2-deoxyribosyltransferase